MRVVLADDHLLVLDALEAYLSALQPDIQVTQATTFEDALQGVSDGEPPDLVILDVRMPGMNGLGGLGVIKERLKGRPIVLISGQADGPLIREALRQGAAGFVTKDMEGKAILKALELVLAGEVYVPTLALSNDTHVGNDDELFAEDLERATQARELTSRQLQVLDLLAQGLTNKEIARSLAIKEVTVAFHVKAIFRKLKVSTRTAAVRMALCMSLRSHEEVG